MFRILALIVLALFPAALLADVITLKDGRVIEGEVTQDDGKVLKVKLKKGTLTLDRKEVVSVVEKPTPEEEYKTRLAKLDGKSAPAQLELAQWAAGRDLPDEALYHFLEAAKLDPTLKAASEALVQRDYHLVDGVWQDPDTYYPRQGYLKLDGKWYSPAEHPYRVALKEVERRKRAVTEAKAAGSAARAKSARIQGLKNAEEAAIVKSQRDITRAENDSEAALRRVAAENEKAAAAVEDMAAEPKSTDGKQTPRYLAAERRAKAAQAAAKRAGEDANKARDRIKDYERDIKDANERIRELDVQKSEADAEVAARDADTGRAELELREEEAKAKAAREAWEKAK